MMKVYNPPQKDTAMIIDLSQLDIHSPQPPIERRQVKQPLPLTTTRYQNWRETSGLPVGVTVGRPRFWRGALINVSVLAPHELFLPRFKNINNIPIERRVYWERLRVCEHEILAALQELARQYPDTPATLMCFEDVNGKAGPDGCHRRWFAQWVEARFGWEIPELPTPEDATPPHPRTSKPKPPAPPTLF